MSWRVIIPSYKRAGKVRAAALFPADKVTVVVGMSQFEAYTSAQPELHLERHDDEFDGHGMAVKRQMVLDRTDDNVLMVDDDVKSIKRWEGPNTRALDVDEVAELLDMGFELARQLGAPLWGVNIKADARSYSKMRPFSLLSPILGPFCGIVREHLGNIRYDGRFYAKEDYDFWLQCIYHRRRTLRLNQFHIVKQEEQTGGLSRTFDAERAEARLIERKWGDIITYGTGKNILDGTIRMPIPGV